MIAPTPCPPRRSTLANAIRTAALFALASGLGLATPACASSPLAPVTLDVGGRARTTHLFVPPTPPAGLRPAVIALHGGGGRGDRFDRSTAGTLTAAAARRGWLVAFPEGVAKGWNDGRPPATDRDRERADVDDVAFLRALAADLAAHHGADPARLYVAGLSNGGFMAQRLALDAPNTFAAFAAVAANLPTHLAASAAQGPPTPLLYVLGTDDPVVPWAGGQVEVFGLARGEVLSADASTAWWRARFGCSDGAPSITPLPDAAPDDGTRAEEHRYPGCTGARTLALVRVAGGGHGWPGGRQYLPERLIGRVSEDFDASERVLAFFEGRSLPPAPAR